MKKIINGKIHDTNHMFLDVLVSIRRIMQAIDLHSRYLFRNYGLTGPQLVILQELTNKGEISIGELAKAISLGQATVTGILTRLENQGLVTRRRSEEDKRRVLVTTTKKCVRLLKSAPPPIQVKFMERFNNLLDWEQAMILSSLQRLAALMDANSLETSSFLTANPVGNLLNPLPVEGSMPKRKQS
jgi:DNA-binding MarR family transcriptional regulator